MLRIILICRTFSQPFGEALVTIVVPQLRRGENSLLLWNMSNLNAPIYTFAGHTDVVLEFQWRHPRLGSTIIVSEKYFSYLNISLQFYPSIFIENNDFELITWSKDQCLRIFKIDPFLKKVIIYMFLLLLCYFVYYRQLLLTDRNVLCSQLCGNGIDDGISVYSQYSEENNLSM